VVPTTPLASQSLHHDRSADEAPFRLITNRNHSRTCGIEHNAACDDLTSTMSHPADLDRRHHHGRSNAVAMALQALSPWDAQSAGPT
jgi:hypothetical protein